jgi:hypothetical protein
MQRLPCRSKVTVHSMQQLTSSIVSPPCHPQAWLLPYAGHLLCSSNNCGQQVQPSPLHTHVCLPHAVIPPSCLRCRKQKPHHNAMQSNRKPTKASHLATLRRGSSPMRVRSFVAAVASAASKYHHHLCIHMCACLTPPSCLGCRSISHITTPSQFFKSLQANQSISPCHPQARLLAHACEVLLGSSDECSQQVLPSSWHAHVSLPHPSALPRMHMLKAAAAT